MRNRAWKMKINALKMKTYAWKIEIRDSPWKNMTRKTRNEIGNKKSEHGK